MMKPIQIARAMVATKPTAWADAIEGLSTEEQLKIVKTAERQATLFAAVARYVEMRGGLGYGDKGHALAVQYANNRKRHIHQTMGYSLIKEEQPWLDKEQILKGFLE